MDDSSFFSKSSWIDGSPAQIEREHEHGRRSESHPSMPRDRASVGHKENDKHRMLGKRSIIVYNCDATYPMRVLTLDNCQPPQPVSPAVRIVD